MTSGEKVDLEEFTNNGSPGLSKIEDLEISRLFEMYLSGHSYGEISEASQKPKNIILSLSKNNNWYVKKMTYFNDIAIHFADKTRLVKLESANTILNVQSALSKFIGNQASQYIKTNNPKHLEKIDSKVLQSFFKAIEALDKITNPTNKDSSPQIDINLSNSQHKIEEKQDGVEITTKNSNGDILSILASYKKSQSK